MAGEKYYERVKALLCADIESYYVTSSMGAGISCSALREIVGQGSLSWLYPFMLPGGKRMLCQQGFVVGELLQEERFLEKFAREGMEKDARNAAFTAYCVSLWGPECEYSVKNLCAWEDQNMILAKLGGPEMPGLDRRFRELRRRVRREGVLDAELREVLDKKVDMRGVALFFNESIFKYVELGRDGSELPATSFQEGLFECLSGIHCYGGYTLDEALERW